MVAPQDRLAQDQLRLPGPSTTRGSAARPQSYHTLGMAADIVVRDIDMEELARKAALVRAFLDGGIGTYAGWVHVDVRGYGRRWRG